MAHHIAPTETMLSAMSNANETIKQAVKDTLGVLTEHIQPDDLDAQGRSIKQQDSALRCRR
jgi:hypothetical protein